MKTQVVTGAAGFVGSHLVKELLFDPTVEKVIGIDRFSDYYSTDLKESNIEAIDDPRFALHRGDLNELNLDDILDGATTVFHQAGQPGVRPSWGKQFDLYVSDNISATQKLLEAVARAESKPSMVYASSSSVYGDADIYPCTEETVPKPRSPYGVTKLAAEHLVALYARQFDVSAVSLRYFTVYGPGQRPDMAFTKFCKAALSGQPIEIYGDGRQVREFTFVKDIVAANLLAATSETDPGQILNISGGAAVTLTECIDLIEEVSAVPIARRFVGAMPGDVRRTGATGERAREVLGWTPKTTLEDGLQAQFDWARTVAESEV